MKRAGHSVSRARPLCDGVGKQDGFRIQNGGEAAVHPGRVNLGQIGYIHVSAFQTACGGDDVQPVGQRVLVPVNVIKSAVHLLVVLSRGPHAGLAEIDTEAPQIDHTARRTADVRHGHRLPVPDGQAGTNKKRWRSRTQLQGTAGIAGIRQVAFTNLHAAERQREDAAPAHIGDRVNKPALTGGACGGAATER
ncbi:Uncharacterised protein [Klebsiella pneumoniae]|nr:Uncharacterised protein [Klebsiella pneumoniae]